MGYYTTIYTISLLEITDHKFDLLICIFTINIILVIINAVMFVRNIVIAAQKYRQKQIFSEQLRKIIYWFVLNIIACMTIYILLYYYIVYIT